VQTGSPGGRGARGISRAKARERDFPESGEEIKKALARDGARAFFCPEDQAFGPVVAADPVVADGSAGAAAGVAVLGLSTART
jgi:hypothetical protein